MTRCEHNLWTKYFMHEVKHSTRSSGIKEASPGHARVSQLLVRKQQITSSYSFIPQIN